MGAAQRITADELQSLVEERDLRAVRDRLSMLQAADIAELLHELTDRDQAIVIRVLSKDLATETFEYLDVEHQKAVLSALGDTRVAKILNGMASDDRTALLEEFPPAAARQLIMLLSKEERAVALTLLGYPEGSVGRLASPDYVTIREEWTMREVLLHVREHGHDAASLNVLYVLDDTGRLLDDIRLRDVVLSSPDTVVHELMNHQFEFLEATADQESAVHVFRKYDRTTLPVIDSQEMLIGIVTVDDVLDVAEAAVTEDMHKLGGLSALEEPYLRVSLFDLLTKRAVWLVLLFFGATLTASAMAHYEEFLSRSVLLAVFIPLVISSGGNSGSQAAMLITRALAVGEITLRDWARVLYREVVVGVALGALLGVLGLARVALWFSGASWDVGTAGAFGATISLSILAIVLFGVLTGAMLPILLEKMGLDPATSSTPFVATIVDFVGVILYFSIAQVLLE